METFLEILGAICIIFIVIAIRDNLIQKPIKPVIPQQQFFYLSYNGFYIYKDEDYLGVNYKVFMFGRIYAGFAQYYPGQELISDSLGIINEARRLLDNEVEIVTTKGVLSEFLSKYDKIDNEVRFTSTLLGGYVMEHRCNILDGQIRISSVIRYNSNVRSFIINDKLFIHTQILPSA